MKQNTLYNAEADIKSQPLFFDPMMWIVTGETVKSIQKYLLFLGVLTLFFYHKIR